MQNSTRFLKKFLDSPATVGSIIPSSRMLVSAMLAPVDWVRAETIVELGAGTGVITRAIEGRRRTDSTFLAFESDSQMRRDLNRQYPDILTEADAFHLHEALERRGLPDADCVISGLPFANFPRNQQAGLITAIHDALRPGGLFVAFQYTRQLQPYLDSVYGDIARRLVLFNIPPALVYICRKEA
ncbi:class I SAM-dependent methyltransferase [Thiohalospira sp.]|uniref:class I SAM-dependent methyltransferase n=1 Tax=Thiohalospira sp. TaxID=3080549 RepID=UPI00397F5FE1